MIATGQRAFANARLRALKSQLVTGDARRAGSTQSHPALDLVACYHTVLVSLPAARSLTLTLLDRLELENVKLLWRAVTRGHAPSRWMPLWRPLKAFERVSLDTARECTSLTQIVDILARTPYGAVAGAMWRGHRDDVLAADLGFDQWMSQRMLAAATALDDGELGARRLICRLVGEADLNLLRRGVSTYRLSADAVAGAVVFLSEVMAAEELASVAAWTPAQGGFAALWPRAFRHLCASAPDWDALLLRWRRARYHACRRAFVSEPFSLAPAIALVLLVEEEARAVAALAQSGAGAADTPSLAFALAASAMGH